MIHMCFTPLSRNSAHQVSSSILYALVLRFPSKVLQRAKSLWVPPDRLRVHWRLCILTSLRCRFLTKPSTLRSTRCRGVRCARRLLAGYAWAMPSAARGRAAQIGAGKSQTWSAFKIGRQRLRSAWCRDTGRAI